MLSLSSIVGDIIGLIGLIILVLVLLSLEVLYGVGVYKCKRWVLPIALVFSLSSIVFGGIYLFNQNFSGIFELLGVLVGMAFMLCRRLGWLAFGWFCARD